MKARGMSNRFAPGGMVWLLGFEIKMYWRDLFGAKGDNPWPRIGLLAILGVVLLAFGFMVSSILATVDPSPNPPALMIVLTTLALGLPASLMVSQATGAVINVVYTRGDLPLLFSSPISPWTVSLSRALGVVLNVSLLYIVLLVAVFIWAPLTGALAWAPLLPTVIALAMAATAVGMLLALTMMRLIGPRHSRTVSQVLAGLLGAAFFIAAQSFNFLPEQREDAVVANGMAWLRAIEPSAWNPIWAPARAALGHWPSQLATFGLGAAFLSAATFLFSRAVSAHVAAVQGLSAAAPRRAAHTRPMRQGVMANLVRKEWRLLRRDPMLLFQISLQMAYMIPLLVVMAANLGIDPRGASAANGVFAGVCVLLAASLASSLVWLTASAEDAPELIGASPLGRGRVEAAKFIAAVTPVMVLNLAPAALFALSSPKTGLVVLLVGAAAASTAALLGVWYQRPGSRREFRRQRQSSLVAGVGQAILSLSWSGVAGLFVADLAPWAAIPLILVVITVFVLEDGRPRGARDVAIRPHAPPA